MTCFCSCLGRNNSSATGQTVDTNEELNAEIPTLENVKLYSYRELQMATKYFSPTNKIGQGGFGIVYKGKLNDGTLAAIKVLSAESEQGVREFLNEISVLSGLEHENLVKFYGCCVERGQRMLVYPYLENNSLARTLLEGQCSAFQFSWKRRAQICIGVAQGLAFLHELRPHIVHRDIKASNVLLDEEFTAKISDFGLAKLFPATMTHITTRITGTRGYLAPEYAVMGKLTRKADVYSFGVLLLEIVSGSCNTNKRLPPKEQHLLERAWKLHEEGNLAELVDIAVEGDSSTADACRYLKIALLCTQEIPKLRPNMSTVVKMLNNSVDIGEEMITKPGLIRDGAKLKSSACAEPVSSEDKSSSLQSSTNLSCATMTFTSIYDRSN